jgi:hypothetical protein
MRRRILLVLVIALPLCLLAQERVDLSAIHRIKAEAFQNSKVMDHAFYLTDVHGPLLAGSPNYRAAAEWVVKTVKSWGIEDAKLEKWGTLGRSWSHSRFSVHMLEPQQIPLIGIPQSWAPGTDGPLAAEVVLAPIRTLEEAAKFKGQLKGKIVLTEAARELPLPTAPDSRRYTDAELAELAKAPEPGPVRPPFAMLGPQRPGQPAPQFRSPEQFREQRAKLTQFFKDEGVAALVMVGSRGNYGTIFTNLGGLREANDVLPPPTIILAAEHYNRVARLVEKKIPVKLEIDYRAQFHENQDGFNVVANLPGGRKKDEVVMLGAHLDTHYAATGATDNVSGCSVMLEALRILKTLDLKMDRTVRLALWDGEELGFLGSRGYVKAHFADRETMQTTAEHARLAAYFNYDNGGGKIRGIYAQGNDMVRPIFQAWLDPLADLGASTVTIRNTGGTDHLSFDEVGLPGFQFIQDPLDYGTRTHHTNMDTYDRLQRGDLMQSSAVVACFVYHAATRPELLPRKPMPRPRSGRRFE